MNPGLQPPEPIHEAFADVFNMQLNPYGVVLSFGRREPVDFQDKPIEQRPIETVSRVLLTAEHLKHMIYLLWRQTVSFEREHGIINVPVKLLEGVDLAEWNALFQVPAEPAPPALKPVPTDGVDPVAITAAVNKVLAEREAGQNENRQVASGTAEAEAASR